MVATKFHQSMALATMQLNSHGLEWGSHKKFGNYSLKLISKGLTLDSRLLTKGSSISTRYKLHLVHSWSCHSSLTGPVSTISHSTNDDKKNATVESALVLIRHGESLYNEMNIFTGSVDVPLTKKGVEEATEAGRRISSIPVDVIYTSLLIRAKMTAMLAMNEHRQKKVPIIMHMESDEAKEWSQVYSEETKAQSIPVITAWQLNERMYGELQGLHKLETIERFGKEKVQEWRRSYDIPPPGGESLEMCSHRAVSYFREHIEPRLQSGKHVMISAHGNILRSIVMYLDKLTTQEVSSLELSTGVPLLYICKEGEVIRRGSPVGPTQAGVYAYTENLAIYRQKLDENV